MNVKQFNLLTVILLMFLPLDTTRAQENPPPRFAAVDVFVDAGDAPLAAYQLDLRAANEDLKIVGIEGGEHPAYRQAPHYDPKAMQGNRVILAAFSTRPSAELPSGRIRVARVHIQLSGAEPDLTTRLIAAADAEGSAITAKGITELLTP